MTNRILLLIDVNQNYNLNESNKHFININKGIINLKNCKQIYLKDFIKSKKKIYTQLLNRLKNEIIKNEENKFFFAEMELFNLRNDRYQAFDRIINLLLIKKIISKKKIKKIKIISDNKSTLDIFKNINIEIEKIDLSYERIKFSFIKLKIIKFYLKTLFLTFYIKLFRKKKINIKKNNFYMSIFPNEYLYGKSSFINQNIFNFLLSDETHLNASLGRAISNFKYTYDRQIINIEEFIYIKDIVFLILKTVFGLNKYKKLKLDKILIENLSLKKELKELSIGSFINRSKLEIYNEALPRFLKKHEVSKINLYMFEYSFGFYLIRTIKQFSSKISILGYQHGIFTRNLMWYDLINKLSFKKYYKPHCIVSSNKYNVLDYKSKSQIKRVFVNKLDTRSHKAKVKFTNLLNINKYSKNVLVIPGTHDVKDLYYFIKNNPFFKNKIFYFKLHPKNKFNLKENKKIKKIDSFFNKNFSKIIISQTSSIIYDFLTRKKKFSLIELDYKQNIIPKNIVNKANFINSKKVNFL